MTGLLEALDKVFREQAIKIKEQATVIESQRGTIDRLRAVADERAGSIVALSRPLGPNYGG